VHVNAIYLGIRGYVLAVDRATGQELWRTRLKGSDFVNVVLDGGALFATARGELYRVDPVTGSILWTNRLAGLGRGLITLAGAGQAVSAAEKQRLDAAAAAASAAL
jgi:outer membrane protein assembly factor BamB